MNHVVKMTALATVLSATSGIAFADSANSNQSWTGTAKDAWLDGKIETMYLMNEHLNPFKIDTDVKKGAVTLTGTVDSDIDKELAGSLAKDIEGVTTVTNNLKVDGKAEKRDDSETSFMQQVDAATTTASIKTQLFLQKELTSTNISVETAPGGVVTLSGTIPSDKEKDLAVATTKDVDGVTKVVDDLVVSKPAENS
ncbi:BON domain-containing protein [Pokkaliibacter sp. CJK22405]|uniref:BON domain-containing protein n=1 Tax=Pokkaliibacter sp. CJK22405 TaxID=3384615 RepID=UPI0039850412